MRVNYQRCVRSIYRHHLAILLGAALLAVGTGFLAARLKIHSDLADLLPRDYVSVRELNRIKAQVGGIGPLPSSARPWHTAQLYFSTRALPAARLPARTYAV